MHPLELTLRAYDDLDAAYAWYAGKSSELAARFDEAVARALNEVGDHPFRYPELQPGVRRIIVDRFPYKVIYRVRSDAVVEVLAVYHGARAPEGWDDARRD